MDTSIVNLVRTILRNPYQFKWSLQGFGMLRLYLADDKIQRLHVWDSRYAVQDVSNIHTHPWNFRSTIVAGKVRNRIYSENTTFGQSYVRARIKCGADATIDEKVLTHLNVDSENDIGKGENYCQFSDQIHESMPMDGTVTLVTRDFIGDTEHAFVYYPYETSWVDAKPRKATQLEIEDITRNALTRWF